MTISQIRFVAGSPDAPFEMSKAMRLPQGSAPVIARLGFAYASNSGLEVLLAAMDKLPAWQTARKEWIIGLHHGITEPKALDRIRGISNSNVRAFAGAERPSIRDLIHGQLFHAKIISITAETSTRTPILMLASSANLTGAALAASARNYEAGIALYGSAISQSEHARFEGWWRRGWNASVEVTDGLISSYARHRESFLRRNPDVIETFDPPSASQLSDANTLWIEAGAMSGGSRNQVEFNEELAAFFGPVEQKSHLLRIRANGKEWDDRPLSHKVTTFGVHIWRLSLPTENKGGFTYPGRVLRFRKMQDGAGDYFLVDIAEPESTDFGHWRSTAHRRGYVGITSGQRAYGFWLA